MRCTNSFIHKQLLNASIADVLPFSRTPKGIETRHLPLQISHLGVMVLSQTYICRILSRKEMKVTILLIAQNTR